MSGTARFWPILLALVLVWCALLQRLMIVDVWDETRALQLVLNNDFTELVSTNWLQGADGGRVLFRPLPSLLFTAIAKVVGQAEAAWRVLRWLNAGLVLAALGLLISALHRVRGADTLGDGLLAACMLFGGSAIISATWFANVFDVSALVLVALGVNLLARGRGVGAGIALGLSFFCKEIAVVGMVAAVSLAWTRDVEGRQARRAVGIASALLLLYIAARWLVVSPGSAADLRGFSPAGFLHGLLLFPDTLAWQSADVVAPGIGFVVLLVLLSQLKTWRGRAGVGAVVLVSAVVYGPLVHAGETPILDADNFAGRLYLLPMALVLLLTAIHGRRLALIVLLPTVLWGGVRTAERHHDFQSAYHALYVAVASEAAEGNVAVDSEVYASPFVDSRRNVILGPFPEARWRLGRDGRVYHRPDAEFDWVAIRPR